MILVVARLRSPCVYSITWIAISYKMKLWWFFCQKKALHLSDRSVETFQFPGRKQWNAQTLTGDGLWARTKRTHTHSAARWGVCLGSTAAQCFITAEHFYQTQQTETPGVWCDAAVHKPNNAPLPPPTPSLPPPPLPRAAVDIRDPATLALSMVFPGKVKVRGPSRLVQTQKPQQTGSSGQVAGVQHSKGDWIRARLDSLPAPYSCVCSDFTDQPLKWKPVVGPKSVPSRLRHQKRLLTLEFQLRNSQELQSLKVSSTLSKSRLPNNTVYQPLSLVLVSLLWRSFL